MKQLKKQGRYIILKRRICAFKVRADFENKRKTYKLGQKVRVKMIDCDEISRTIDFRLVKERKEEREDG